MHIDGLVRERAQLGENSLRLAKRVAKQKGGDPPFAVRAPPAMHFLDDPRRVGPTIDRQGEGGFADENITLDRLEWRAGRVRLALVVARDHPDATFVLDTNLRGSENV